ncbi:MAG: methionyl-tRNA formyltransferase [Candidatus Jacksonbacteria bacterium RIFCSPLOWO2_01_FULL_44_13]|nr:MAG: methionyl-tRNA formyltransferase [Candidatus Jacksonbacteria bacterium RIFCSPLOWO2_01_FULL_44_13]
MTHSLEIVFCGTSSFAVPILEALFSTSEITVRAIVTQPDRPAGRHRQLCASPVKQSAQRYSSIPLFQPKEKDALEQCIRTIQPEIVCVVSYGMILPHAVLEIPRSGCVNIHGSLLPRYRGASPIQEAILCGDNETGISWILMDDAMDHGPVLMRKKVSITLVDTTPTLSDRLSRTAALFTPTVLLQCVSGELSPQAQEHDNATYTKKITKDSGRVDWNNPADSIERMIRAYSSWPGVFCFYGAKRLLIHTAISSGIPGEKHMPCGTVFLSPNGFPAVVCGNHSALELEQIQCEGKSRISGSVFLRGYSDIIGHRLV